jgi:hypothetical protein
MQKVKNVLKNRALLTLLAIVTVWGTFTFMLVPEAQACPANDVDITYYTDASKTVECGYKIITCGCQTASSGCRTPYYTAISSPCF